MAGYCLFEHPIGFPYLPLNDAEIVFRVAGDKRAENGGDAQ
jgi:hypothetical protein